MAISPRYHPQWSSDAIADALLAALQQREDDLRAEHAVYGLDSLAELDFHPLFAAALSSAGFGVLREVPYPHEWSRKLKPDTPKLPEFRDRQRCDIVLTEYQNQKLSDALTTEKQRRADQQARENSLFADVPIASDESPSNLIAPEDAFWLEIKLVGQYCYSAGVPGPNRSYSSELTRNMIADLAKLAADDHISTAALGIILFTDTIDTAKHDLAMLVHKCLDKDLPVSSPITRTFPIRERIGNHHCTIALITFRK